MTYLPGDLVVVSSLRSPRIVSTDGSVNFRRVVDAFAVMATEMATRVTDMLV